MVGWLYIDERVAAPVRVLEVDSLTGMISIEIAAKFVPNRAVLRGQTVVEYRGWKRRRVVRCLGAEQIGSELMIEAVDVGTADPEEAAVDHPRGAAEDWLVVDGQARCRVGAFRAGHGPGSIAGHCLFNVPLTDWRDLRIGEGAVLAGVGISADEVDANDGSITPLLHSARERALGEPAPTVEMIRLRERTRYTIAPIATDWGEDSTLVVCRVLGMDELSKPRDIQTQPHSLACPNG